MNEDIFDDIGLERAIGQFFDLKLDIKEVIARNITAGTVTQATVFKTTKNTHYLFLRSQGMLTLGDVQKAVQRMGFEADRCMAPRGDKEYFSRIGVEKFKRLFPGKYIMSEDDTRYYQTLASYNPALVRLAKIKGEILGYDIAGKQWRKVKDYAYTKMQVA